MSDNRATQVLVRAWLDSHEPASSLSSPSRNVRSPSAPIDHDPLHNGSLLTAGWQAPPTWLNLLDSVDKLVDIMDWGQASDDILNWRTSVIVPLSSGWRHFDKEAKDGVLHVLKAKHAYLAQHLKEFKELHHDGRHPNGPRTLFGGWIPPIEEIVEQVDLEVVNPPEANSTGEEYSWFRDALAKHVLQQANEILLKEGVSHIDLQARFREECAGLINLARSEKTQLERIFDTLLANWEALGPLSAIRSELRRVQQRALNLVEVVYRVLQSVIGTKHVKKDLLYLWVPPLHPVLEEFYIAHLAPRSHSAASSHSLVHRRNLLSPRKHNFYFS